MGLFGKLFEKKECSICGGEIGLLGNRKLADGNMCKHCAAKLSPWMTDRRQSTVQDIQEHLAYRERNKEKLAIFNVTRVLGNDWKVYIDEGRNWWLVSRRQKFMEDNPDVLDLMQVTGCEVQIDEDKDEIKKDGEDGKKISYDPPRYRYTYDFKIRIRVNSDWFDEIHFQLNPSSIEGRNSVEYREAERQAGEIKEALTGFRQEMREKLEQEKAPKISLVCPFCKATTTPDEQGRCEFCRGAILG